MTAGETDPVEEAKEGEAAADEVLPGGADQIVAERRLQLLSSALLRGSQLPIRTGVTLICRQRTRTVPARWVSASSARLRRGHASTSRSRVGDTTRSRSRFAQTGSNQAMASGVGGPGHQTRRWWLRSPVSLKAHFAAEDLITGAERAVSPAAGETDAVNLDGLQISLAVYTRPRGDGTSLVTVSLVNRTHPADPVDIGCLFQVRFDAQVEGAGDSGGILPYEQAVLAPGNQDLEEASLELLYRSWRTFAVGHGCAADWTRDSDERASKVSAECLPAYETPSITPDIQDDEGRPITVPIAPLAGLVDADDGMAIVSALFDRYAGWIQHQRKRALLLSAEFSDAANRHANVAELILSRMRAGFELLKNRCARPAGLPACQSRDAPQQLRTRRRNPRETRYNGDEQRIEVVDPLEVPGWRDVSDRGQWRPFQIAFVLMALGSTASAASPEREIVELIFFPDGWRQD